MATNQLEQHAVNRAREIAGLKGEDAIKAYTGTHDPVLALANAFGQAQFWLTELAAIVEQDRAS